MLVNTVGGTEHQAKRQVFCTFVTGAVCPTGPMPCTPYNSVSIALFTVGNFICSEHGSPAIRASQRALGSIWHRRASLLNTSTGVQIVTTLVTTEQA